MRIDIRWHAYAGPLELTQMASSIWAIWVVAPLDEPGHSRPDLRSYSTNYSHSTLRQTSTSQSTWGRTRYRTSQFFRDLSFIMPLICPAFPDWFCPGLLHIRPDTTPRSPARVPTGWTLLKPVPCPLKQRLAWRFFAPPLPVLGIFPSGSINLESFLLLFNSSSHFGLSNMMCSYRSPPACRAVSRANCPRSNDSRVEQPLFFLNFSTERQFFLSFLNMTPKKSPWVLKPFLSKSRLTILRFRLPTTLSSHISTPGLSQ